MSWNGNARLNARRDSNERPIIDVFQAAGFHVDQINGKGITDLLLSKQGRMWLVEIKRPKAKLTAAQVKWRQQFQGPPPAVVRSVDEAIQWVRNL